VDSGTQQGKHHVYATCASKAFKCSQCLVWVVCVLHSIELYIYYMWRVAGVLKLVPAAFLEDVTPANW